LSAPRAVPVRNRPRHRRRGRPARPRRRPGTARPAQRQHWCKFGYAVRSAGADDAA